MLQTNVISVPEMDRANFASLANALTSQSAVLKKDFSAKLNALTGEEFYVTVEAVTYDFFKVGLIEKVEQVQKTNVKRVIFEESLEKIFSKEIANNILFLNSSTTSSFHGLYRAIFNNGEAMDIYFKQGE